MGEHARGQLTIDGTETTGNTVPADVLVQTVQRVQRLVLLAAASQGGRDLRKRFKPSSELRKQHELRFGVPVAGSWGLPFVEAGADHTPDSTSGVALLMAFAAAVQGGNHEQAARIIPQQNFRDLMLVEMRDMAPSEGETWFLDLTLEGGDKVRFDYTTRRAVSTFLGWETDEGPGTFIGELQRINFADQRITLRNPVTGTKIECSYPSEAEDTLLSHRRELVQVLGHVSRADGDVVDVSDVSMVLSVDLEPFSLTRVQGHGRVLVLDPPLQVVPRLDDESQQSFVFRHEALDLDVVAATREALYDEVSSTLVFLWEQYALADDAELTDGARALKSALLARMKEAGRGPEA